MTLLESVLQCGVAVCCCCMGPMRTLAHEVVSLQCVVGECAVAVCRCCVLVLYGNNPHLRLQGMVVLVCCCRLCCCSAGLLVLYGNNLHLGVSRYIFATLCRNTLRQHTHVTRYCSNT